MDYEIEGTQSTTFIGRSGLPVTGWEVRVHFPEFNETHRFNTEHLNPEAIDVTARKLLAERRALSQLGRSHGHD